MVAEPPWVNALFQVSPVPCSCHLDSRLVKEVVWFGWLKHIPLFQEDDLREPKVENWTTFAPCCRSCRYCGRVRCAQFWRQLRGCSTDSCYSWKGSSAAVTERCRGRFETCPTFQASARRCRSASTRQTPTRWMECESGTHTGGIPPRQRRGLLSMRERGESVDGRNALQRVLGSARANNVNE